MNHPKHCPRCGTLVVKYSNPLPTADVIIHDGRGSIVLIRRANPPEGFALPGGFIEEGESAEHAAVREMKEETGLDVILEGVLGIYSHPLRDMRCHTITTVFVGHARDLSALRAGDDAAGAQLVALDAIDGPLCFDHGKVIGHFREHLAGRRPILPCAEDPALEFGEIPYTRPF
ncbi:MAG: NUDIX hydrolase [Mailhella sp.]|nr:NUDIX hydrolase [Mailhella sp.]